MKTILLPTDFSENARNAMRYAIAMFCNEECRFILMNTYKTPIAGASMLVSIDDIMLKETIKMLEEEKEKIAEWKSCANLKIDLRAEFGDIVMGINGVLRSEDVDFVVMGTKGASGLKEVIIGSNTAAAIRKVNKPIIVVPEDAKFNKLSTILLATDYTEIHNQEDITVLKQIASAHNSTLDLLNIKQTSEESITTEDISTAGLNMKSSFEGVNCQLSTFEAEDIPSGILDYMEKEEYIDMLVLVAKKYGFFEEIFHKSVSKKVVAHTQVPTLIINE